MALFDLEEDMQRWLRTQFETIEGLAELIINAETFHASAPMNPEQQRVHDSFAYAYEALHLTQVVSENQNIACSPGAILRPDFLLYSAEQESLVIVELKNQASATRQAGTEVSAYAAAVRGHLPFISDGDIICVIISPVWPPLLRHYIAHEILWIGRKIICLQPVNSASGRGLEIVQTELFSNVATVHQISDREIGGYQLCLYDDELYGDSPNRERLTPHVDRMRTALQAMAAKGNALRGHGFAFLWKDRWEQSLAPYSITLVNSAPFQGVTRFLVNGQDLAKPNRIQSELLKILREFNPEGHGQTLSTLTSVARASLKSICSPQMEGFCDWQTLRGIMIPRAELISFAGWGSFGEQFFAQLQDEYELGHTDVRSDDPILGLKLVDTVVIAGLPYISPDLFFDDDLEEPSSDDIPTDFS